MLRLVAMDDDDRFHTFQEGFEDDTLLDATIGQVGSRASDDHFVDELQALNTALCFLCSVNADSVEVETFLKIHPEALLLEGACLLPEDNAHYILQQRELRCTCQGPCHVNRLRVLDLLDIGFEKFQARRERRSARAEQAWSLHFQDLVQAEHEIRILRRQELSMRNTLTETAVEVRCYQEELEQVYRVIECQGQSRQSALALLGCSRTVNQSNRLSDGSGFENRVAVLEYQVGVASVNMRSVEREHASLLQQIRDGRRTQFAVLQRAFEGCRRHVICSNNTAAPGP
jgi:hypothetical protein